MMLREYIESVVARITADKCDRGVYPASCTLVELVGEFSKDARQVMRQIHREDPRYEGHITVNKTPMLILTDQKSKDNE